MNVEIGTEAAQFPEKEYINGIFFAVHGAAHTHTHACHGGHNTSLLSTISTPLTGY
jgi:hypothetical protein